MQSARLGIKPSVAYIGAVNINYLSKEFIYLMSKSGITNCLRGIRNAWHFLYALVKVFKLVCGGIGIALLTP